MSAQSFKDNEIIEIPILTKNAAKSESYAPLFKSAFVKREEIIRNI